jgi:hypothetical protein
MSEQAEHKKLTFLEELHEQRWDDHRFYHQSRINQSLHLFSACCFLVTYVLIPTFPVYAAFFGWFIAMWVRQCGHFFFEPKGFDKVNEMTHQQKESVKVGFNLQRKVILLGVWCSVPFIVWKAPGAKEFLAQYTHRTDLTYNIAIAWLLLAAAALMARTLYLMLFRSFQTGLVWITKILTDPFHDIKMYHKAPLALLRGELIDPMADVQQGH